MKSLCFIAALLLFLTGCRNTPEKKAVRSLQPIVEHAPKSENVQKPYYYGLIEEYRTVLQEDPGNLAALIGLGNAFSETGAWREAILRYEQALRIDPKNADVHTDLGTAYRNIGLPDRALAEYRIALRHEPAHLDARFKMGIVYAYDFKNYAVVIHVWEELLRLSPSYPQVDYMRTRMVAFRKSLTKGHR
jgi:tetratricopeptide (TPR) repeat protein